MPGAIAFAPGPPAANARAVFPFWVLIGAVGFGPAGGCATVEGLPAVCAWAVAPLDCGRHEAASG